LPKIVLLCLLLTATGFMGCLGGDDETNQDPVADFTFSPGSPKSGEQITFDATSSNDPDGSIVNYSWSFGDSTSGTGVTATHTYNKYGQYPVTLTVTDNKGATATKTKQIIVTSSEVDFEKVRKEDIFSNPYPYENKLVNVSGLIITDLAYFATNQPDKTTYVWVQADWNSPVRYEIFWLANTTRPSSLKVGDVVDVLALFARYNTTWEFKIENDMHKVILNGTSNPTYQEITVAEFIANPEQYNNTYVNVSDAVILEFNSLYNYSYFHSSLNQTEKKYEIYVKSSYTGPYQTTRGDVVTVWGRVTLYQKNETSPQIWEIVLAGPTDGMMITGHVNESYTYTHATIDAIMANPENYNGTRVVVYDAVVVEVKNSYTWNVTDNGSSTKIMLYAERNSNYPSGIATGTHLDIWAIVTLYSDTWELKITNATDDKIVINGTLPQVQYNATTVSAIVADPLQFNNTRVVVYNVTIVEKKSSSTVNVTDQGGVDKLMIYSTINTSYLVVGANITVWGTVILYNGTWEIKVTESTDGIVVNGTLPSKWINANLADIIADPESYNGTRVNVTCFIFNLTGYTNSGGGAARFNVSTSSGGGDIMYCYAQNAVPRPDSSLLSVGTQVCILAQVSYYSQGQVWQLYLVTTEGDRMDIVS
ncbi:MAG: PKD domain-containing protein, partial [Thermoplasmata archaeon]